MEGEGAREEGGEGVIYVGSRMRNGWLGHELWQPVTGTTAVSFESRSDRQLSNACASKPEIQTKVTRRNASTKRVWVTTMGDPAVTSLACPTYICESSPYQKAQIGETGAGTTLEKAMI